MKTSCLALLGAFAVTCVACAASNDPSTPTTTGDPPTRTGSIAPEPNPSVDTGEEEDARQDRAPDNPEPRPEDPPAPPTKDPPAQPAPTEPLPPYVMIQVQGALINARASRGACWDSWCDEAETKRVFDLASGLAAAASSVVGVDSFFGKALVELAKLADWQAPDVYGSATAIVGGARMRTTSLATRWNSFDPIWERADLDWVPMNTDTALEIVLWDNDPDWDDDVAGFTLPASVLEAAWRSKRGGTYYVPVAEETRGRVLFIQIAVHARYSDTEIGIGN